MLCLIVIHPEKSLILCNILKASYWKVIICARHRFMKFFSSKKKKSLKRDFFFFFLLIKMTEEQKTRAEQVKNEANTLFKGSVKY